MATERFLALDLGAGSGRGMVGVLDTARGRVSLDEVHRFANTPVRLGDTLYWDLPLLMAECRTAIGKASETGALSGIGVDTWGVDFGLLDARGDLLGLPVHYRDRRNDGMIEKVYASVPRAEVFARTGIQTMQINTLFQLAALRERNPQMLDAAARLLFIPDLFHYFLTGRAEAEYTIATTSQMYDSRSGGWATSLLEKLGLPTHILPNVVLAGTEYGPLTAAEAEETGAAPGIPVIAPAGHDTGSAVAAVPAEEGDGWAYLSSGTWSLLGLEVPAPVITPEAEAANVTNEGGVDGTIRLLKNIGGMWLIEGCRRAYARLGDERSYDQLSRLAADARPMAALVDPDHPTLLAPDDMPKAIRELCAATGQAPPEGIGATIRCCLDSLALKYRVVLATMERLTGRTVHTLHIVGGGSQNRLLNQIAADATGCRVLAGPVEATALGNILIQAKARGMVESLDEVRRIVRASFVPEVYEPDPAAKAQWDEVAAKFSPLLYG
jgi:Sugar (pentulose and hexulose) kinases